MGEGARPPRRGGTRATTRAARARVARERVDAKLLPVAAFALGNAIGLPFVDRPVTLDTVAKSLLVGVETPGETGIFGFKEMDHLAARF